jgi:predicted nucleic acid-binding protein
MNFLCDSNSVSELMKPAPHEMVEKWFSHQDFIFMSVVSIEEIYYGLTYKDAHRKKAWFKNFIFSFPIFSLIPPISSVAIHI